MEKRKLEPGITLRPKPDERAAIEKAAGGESRSLANYCLKAVLEYTREHHPELFQET